MKKVKPVTLILLALLLALITYLEFSYKEVKQTFIQGISDGRAEKAKEEKRNSIKLAFNLKMYGSAYLKNPVNHLIFHRHIIQHHSTITKGLSMR